MRIVFYIGPSWKPWDPNTIKLNGEGGSEIATMQMSKLLAAKGHQVFVYNDPQQEGIYDGVEYLHHSKFINLEADVLIASRTPGAVDDRFHNTFQKKILWHHDMHVYDSLTEERSSKIDLHLALSDYHLQYLKAKYPFIQNIRLTSNGLDLNLYNQSVARNPHKAIYSSSPNRGLHVACQMWKEIRSHVPDAELHVFYGFDNWSKTVENKNDPIELMEMRLIKGLAESTPGVILRGRVNAQQLANEQLSAGVWCYPTAWHETSCITAMEAQAAGMYTVTTDLAALPETVGDGDYGALLPGNNETLVYQREFIKQMVAFMQVDSEVARQKIKDRAISKFDWNKVCDQWIKEFI